MRAFLIISAFIAFAPPSGAQDLNALKQRWLTKELEEFYVGDLLDTVVKLPKVYEKTSYLLNDTIFHHAAYKRTFGGGREDVYTETKRYEIIQLKRDTLVLRMPLRYGDVEKRIDTFYSEKSLVDRNFRFEKLQLVNIDNYLLSNDAKVFSVVISESGDIIYRGEHNTKPFTGVYKGRLSRQQMHKLLNILGSMAIQYQPKERDCPIDAGRQELIVYVNNKRYETRGCEGNHLLNMLLKFLCDLNETKGLMLKKYTGAIHLEN
jgi:hypothetical protein